MTIQKDPSPCLKRAARLLGKPGQRLTDAELIAGCLAGVAAAWDALLERYQALLYAVLRREGLDEAAAGDVFQNVCLLLLEHLPALRDHGRLASWLAVTARREAAHCRRREVLASELGSADHDVLEVLGRNAPDLLEEILRLEEGHLMRLGLAQLGSPCRALLELLYREDPVPPYTEVAARLRMPVGSVGPRRGRCLAALRDILQEFGF
jgi:RNA polymerase sigma factor (sigma-70 family)